MSGTKLVGARLLQLKPKNGILNLHTGISPYVKGGPNCTNWCIATNNFHLIGNTIMWLDEGIDTGALIQQEAIDITPKDSLLSIYAKCAATGANLIHRALNELEKVQFEPVKQPRSANYYKSPHKNDVNDFRKRGGKFYYVRDL